MPLGLIKDEIIHRPTVVFKSQSLSREAKIYMFTAIYQISLDNEREWENTGDSTYRNLFYNTFRKD